MFATDGDVGPFPADSGRRAEAEHGEPSRNLAAFFFFLTLLKRFTLAGHLTTSPWRCRSYIFQGFNLRGSKFHLLAAGGEVGGFMCRTRRGDEEHIYLTVKRVVNPAWEEKKKRVETRL